MKTVRIGSGAGFAGDRIEPAVDLAIRGHLDFLVFECLAERTIALAQLRKQRGGHPGYDPLLEEHMGAARRLPSVRRPHHQQYGCRKSASRSRDDCEDCT